MRVINEQSLEPKSEAKSTPPSDTSKDTAAPRHAGVAQSWRRRLFLDCGCSEQCRCDDHQRPTDKQIDAYREAVIHLDQHGLTAAPFRPEMRAMWTRGERAILGIITSTWAVMK